MGRPRASQAPKARRPGRHFPPRDRRRPSGLAAAAITAVVVIALIPFCWSTTPVEAAALQKAAVSPAPAANESSSEAGAADVDSTTPAGAASNQAAAPPFSGPPAIPASGHAYLGAFVDPDGKQLSANDPTGQRGNLYGPPGAVQEVSDLAQLNQNLTRPLSLVSVYQSWASPVFTTQLDQILAAGAIPLITWSCGASDAAVAEADGTNLDPAASAASTVITQFAQQLKAFGGPVLLRWFPDANNPQTALTQGGKVHTCLGDSATAANAAAAATNYVGAFQAIHNLFAGAGATNVSFVWSVDPTTPCTKKTCWTDYDPGTNYVDWYGADAYSETQPPPALAAEFGSTAAGGWYSTYAGTGKPMLISTAAVNGTQTAYLQQLTQLPTQLPDVKGLVYFDAPGKTTQPPTRYQLSASGLKSLESLSGEDQFQADSGASPAVSISATSNQPTVGKVVQAEGGQVVRLTANVAVPDRGGTVDFLLANGQPIPGCAAVPVNLASTCETSSLTAGLHQVTARYNGDAEYPGAQSSQPVWLRIAPTSGSTAAYCDLTGPSGSSNSDPAGNLCGPPSIPGPGKAYLGAFVKPSYSTSTYPAGATPTEDELVDLPNINGALTSGGGQPLSMVHVYQEWTTPVPAYQLQEILAAGAIPLIDWKCGDTDAHVTGGDDDAMIQSFAAELAQLKSPVFLRWFYEPNFPGSSADAACLGSDGPAGFVAAWRHIWQVFQKAGATNVAFVWSIGAGGRDQDLINYYPGSAYVDWIAADGYDRPKPHQPATFTERFQSWYDEFSTFGLPMMVGESGAFGAAQGKWLQDAATQLSDPSPTGFSQIRAMGYFDTSAAYDYSLTTSCTQSAAGLNGCGLKEFRSLAASTLFQPFRHATGVSPVSLPAYEASPIGGQEVQLSADLSSTDFGGSVSFWAQGTSTPLRGCAAIPVSQGTACNTDALPVGATNVVAVYNGDPSFAPSRSQPLPLVVRPAPAATRTRAPSVPPPGHAYLGAWINPTPSAFPPGAEIKALPAFDAQLGRPLSIVHLYQGWNDLTPDYLMRAALGAGAIPMIDWSCAPATPGYADSDAAVIAGSYDSLIRSFAEQLAALKAPVFLRWYYEPNFPESKSYAECIGSSGQPGDYGPVGYQRAFQHIHDIFQAAGADNVAFVWAVDVNSTASQQQLDSYYPGGAYVDWIAADGYMDTPTAGANAVEQMFDGWYAQFSTYGKPMMISETAAISGQQASYLDDLAAALSPPPKAAAPMAAQAANPSTPFPLIRAVSYFDAPGRFQQNAYALDSGGLAAFQSLSKLPYFLPPQQPSTTSVTVFQTPARTATRVQLTANIDADNGGTVSFSDNGSPISACQNVPLVSGATCTTTSMPAGSTGSIQATYSGDAAFMSSTSAPEALAVMTWSGAVPRPPGKPSRGGGLAEHAKGGGAGGTPRGMVGPSVATGSGSFPTFSGSPTIGTLAATRFPLVTSPPPSSEVASTGTPLYASDHGVAIGPVAVARPGPSWQGIAVLAALALIASLMAYIAFSWSRDRWRPRHGRPTER